MEITDLITPNVCKSTAFENSWIWYCDECQKHGTGLSAKEVEYYAQSHIDWTSYADERSSSLEWNEETNVDPEGFEPTLLDFSEVDEDERFMYDWEPSCDGAVFIISEGLNKTFRFGDDYTDTTPNQISDLELAQKLREQLGLP